MGLAIGWLADESQTVLTATAVARVLVGVHQSQHGSPLPRLATAPTILSRDIVASATATACFHIIDNLETMHY